MILRSKDGKRRQIVRMGHPVLRQRAEEVGPERFGTRFLRDLERDLIRTMFEDNGAGLAAPQIAVPVRAFAYYVPGDHGEDEVAPRVVVNPELTLIGERDDPGWEGCLSIPGMRGLVSRHHRVRLVGRNVDGEPVEIDAAGFHARVIQHEFDHLDGILFIDRMTDLRTLAYDDEWERYAEDRELPVEV